MSNLEEFNRDKKASWMINIFNQEKNMKNKNNKAMNKVVLKKKDIKDLKIAFFTLFLKHYFQWTTVILCKVEKRGKVRI